MKRLRLLIIISILLVAVAAFLRFRLDAAAAEAAQPAAEETAVIERGDVLITVSASGSIQANQNATLSFSTTGKVIALHVNQGDHVLKGQTLATLDNQTTLDSLMLAQAKLESAQIVLRRLTDKPRDVDVNVAKAQLVLAQAQLYEALHSVDRTQAQIDQLNVSNAKNQLYVQQLTRDANNKLKNDLLQNPRTASQANSLPSDTTQNAGLTNQEFNVQIALSNLAADLSKSGNVGAIANAQAQVTSAQNVLDRLLEGGDKQDIVRAQANIQSAQAAVAQIKAQLDKLDLVAPFDGVVAKLNLHLGQQAPLGPAAILLDTSGFYVDLPIDEVDIARIALGQTVNLKFDSLPGNVLTGKVTRIGQTGEKAGNVVTYTVRVQLDPTTQPLISAMTATATIITGKVSAVVRIPNRFVLVDRQTGKTFATVRRKDGTYEKVEIKLGLRSDTVSEVLSGLNPGDVVVPSISQTGLVGGFGGPAR